MTSCGDVPPAKKAKFAEEEDDLVGDQADEAEEEGSWECAKEEEVGITQYLSDTVGFFGVLKRR